MIEYLLLLVITVAIVAAVSKGVGRPLQNYVQNNVIDLVGCMLRVGQFPTQSFGLCQNSQNTNFDFSGNIGDVNSGNGGDPNGQGNQNSDGNEGNSNAGNDSDNSSNSNNGNQARVRPTNSNGSLNESGGGGFNNSETSRIKIETEGRAENDEIAIGGRRQNFSEPTVVVRRIRRDDGRIGGSFSIQGDGQASKEVEAPTTKAVTRQRTPRELVERAPSQSSFSIPKTIKPRYRQQQKIEKTDFSFVGTIKWVIIIAALFFIVVFAAAQLNSIRKGWTN